MQYSFMILITILVAKHCYESGNTVHLEFEAQVLQLHLSLDSTD